MLDVSNRLSSAAAGGDSGMIVEVFPPLAAGVVSRLLHRSLTRASHARLANQASGQNCLRRSRPGTPSGSDAHPGHRRARLSRYLPALALLLAALSPFAAGPAAADTQLWSATLTVQQVNEWSKGCANGIGAGKTCYYTHSRGTPNLTPASFQYAGTDYRVSRVAVIEPSNFLLAVDLDKTWPTLPAGKALRLHVDGETFRFEDAYLRGSAVAPDHQARWSNSGLAWSVGQQVAVRLTLVDASLSIDADPACGSDVTDLTVAATSVLKLAPAPAQAASGWWSFRDGPQPAPATAVVTEQRWVAEGTQGQWQAARSISPAGQSSSTTYAEFSDLRTTHSGFTGFEYRLKDNTAVTARCTWDFDNVSGGAGASSSNPESIAPLTASLEQVPAEHAGTGTFDLALRLSETVGRFAKSPRPSSFKVTQGRVRSVKQVGAGLWRVRIKPASWREVTVTLAGGRGCDASGAVCTPDGRALSNTVSATVGGQVRIQLKGGKAREGRDAGLDFAVTLSRVASETVSVDYATADGTATAGADYTAASGTLTFAPGETEKTVMVPILDDAIDEGTEKFYLRLSNPQGAYLRNMHREATGTIRNSDPLQAQWLSHFGRMVASDAVASVTARLETPRAAGSHVTLAGQRVNFGEADGGATLAHVLTGLARTFGAPGAPAPDDDPFVRHGLSNPWNDSVSTPAQRVTGRELLLGTSFRAVLGQGAGSQFTSWGQGASVSRFSAAVPGLGLSGESATGSMGMDYERGRLLMGFATTHSVGEGTVRDAGWRYALGSTATMAMPYARLALSDRVSVWGLAGKGSGRLSLDLDGAVPQSYRTDLAMTLAATGVRGDLVTPAEPGGFALALKADAFRVRTESDRVTASEFGSLMGARGESSRVRAMLDGSRTFSLASGAALTPSLELGVRHDAGDAETGTGLEVGAGLGYADPSRGLDMALGVRGLAAHAEQGYEEWGVSGQLRLVPGGAGRGLSMSFTPTWGVDPSGSQRLWALPESTGLAANGEAEQPSSRFDAEAGYGLALFGGRFTGTPNVGLGLSDTAREYRMGWRLTSAVRGDPGFEISLDATRREAANDNGDAEHGVMLRSLVRW